ncbi:MAG TPA: SDR family NAD(P)-dependent oxidoreductase [Pseudonocardiaceae bacterium]|nr:SDR family NAD(P)-dependent oxidoreductase [Pseudonocardiaceae bacterium]
MAGAINLWRLFVSRRRATRAPRGRCPRHRHSGCVADVGTAEGCSTLVATEPSADILVNNVGIYGLEDFFDISDAEWTRYFEVNIMSGVRYRAPTCPAWCSATRDEFCSSPRNQP